MHPWLNWIEHRPPKAGTARSNRAGCAKNLTVAIRRFYFCYVQPAIWTRTRSTTE